MPDLLKTRLRRGEPVLGTFAFIPSPTVVEILGHAGFDFVTIDLEHSPKNWETVENMVRAAELMGMAPLVRVRDGSSQSILEALEVGAQGVVVPFVRDAEQAHRVARAARYAPTGLRGTCTVSRASRFGALRGRFREHTESLDESVLVVAQLEDVGAIEATAEMLRMSLHPDVFVAGRADIASAVGKPGQPQDQLVVALTESMVAQVVGTPAAGAFAGVGIGSRSEVAGWLAKGVRYFTYTPDAAILHAAAAAAVQGFRDAHLTTSSG